MNEQVTTQEIETNAPAVEENLEVAENEEVSAEVAEENTEEQASEEASEVKKEKEEFSAKAKTVIRRRDRRISKLREQKRQLEREVQSLKDHLDTRAKSAAPSESDFDNFGDYIKAHNKWEIQQAVGNRDEQQNAERQQQLEQRSREIRLQQEQEVAQQIQELASTSPDFGKVLSAAADEVGAMPAHLYEFALEMDNAPAALYALAKEGRLSEVYNMRPEFAAAELIAAQREGLRLLQQPTRPPVSTAPKPMTPVKGKGASLKSLAQMSPDEAFNYLKIGK